MYVCVCVWLPQWRDREIGGLLRSPFRRHGARKHARVPSLLLDRPGCHLPTTIGLVQPGTRRGMLEITMGSRNTVPFRIWCVCRAHVCVFVCVCVCVCVCVEVQLQGST